jgi:hypothetical protein
VDRPGPRRRHSETRLRPSCPVPGYPRRGALLSWRFARKNANRHRIWAQAKPLRANPLLELPCRIPDDSRWRVSVGRTTSRTPRLGRPRASRCRGQVANAYFERSSRRHLKRAGCIDGGRRVRTRFETCGCPWPHGDRRAPLFHGGTIVITAGVILYTFVVLGLPTANATTTKRIFSNGLTRIRQPTIRNIQPKMYGA